MNASPLRIATMIVTIGALGFTTYHTRLAQEEYYNPNKHGERPGQFIGAGAERLDLHGTVSQDQFKSLMRGYHPQTGAPLRKSAGKRVKTCAWDIVVSADKSSSTAYALAEDGATRPQLERAFLASVQHLVERIEAATYIRVGSSNTRVLAKPVILCFIHTASRAGDPQFHAHLVVQNIAVTEDGQVGALLSRPYYVRKMMWGALLRCEHTVALQREFPGLRFRATDNGPEIAGIPDAVLQQFSKRRQQIEAELGNLNSKTAAAKALAALKTRDPKQTVPPLTEQSARWRSEAAQLGFYPEHLTKILKGNSPEPLNASKVLSTALATALTRLTQRHSHFDKLELIRCTADAAAGRGVSAQQVLDYVRTELDNPSKIIPLGKLAGRQRFSTPDVLAEEQKVLATAEAMAAGRTHRISFTTICTRLSFQTLAATRSWVALGSDPSLMQDQRAAIKFLAQQSGQLALLLTPTGTAKHDTLSRLGEFYRAAGHAVLGVATTGSGVRRLAEEARIPAVPLLTLLNITDRDHSLAESVKHAAKQLVREAVGRYIGLFPYRRQPFLDQNTVLIVDQAQQISTPDMARLLHNVQRSGSKLLLAGNPDGLQSIQRGVPFASFIQRFPSAKLTEAVRPDHPKDQSNVQRTRAGDTHEVLKDLAARGRLHIAKSRDAAAEKLVADWHRAGGAHHPQDHQILASDREAATKLNDLASKVRREHASPTNTTRGDKSILLPSGETLYAGDRIICERTARRYTIQGGSLGTILGVSRRLNAVQIQLDRGDCVTVPLVTYPHLTRSYALGVWHAPPVRHSYLLLAGQYEDRQSTLVKLSRAVDTTDVYVAQPDSGPEMKELATQLARDRQKTLASDIEPPSIQPRQNG